MNAELSLPKFDRESDLQQAIAQLLQRMEGSRDVQILQGAQELGKDIVFRIEGGFGDTVECACVIKNTKISGSVSSSTGARTVLSQIEQALDTPYLEGAREIYIERVYMITPFPISQESIRSISGRLKEKSGVIQWISGDRLFDLFDKHWPEALREHVNVAEQYAQQIEDETDPTGPLSAIGQESEFGDAPAFAGEVYVSPPLGLSLQVFQVTAKVESLLPTKRALPRLPEADDAYEAEGHMARTRALVEHLATWGLEAAQSALPAFSQLLTTFQRSVRARVKEIEEHVLEERVRSGDKNPEVDMRGRPLKLGDSAEMPTIQRQLDIAVAHARAIDDQLHEELVVIREVGSSLSSRPGEDWLRSDTLMRAQRIEAYCASSPIAFFEEGELFTRELDKGAIDEFEGRVLVVGAPGSGKTSFSRRRALRMAREYATERSSRFPLYVALHRMPADTVPSMETLFSVGMRSTAMFSSSADIPLSESCLLLDGLDEIVDEGFREDVLRCVAEEVEPSQGVIMTSRGHIHSPRLQWLPRVCLGPFGPSEIEDLIQQWLGPEEVATEELLQQIASDKDLQKIMQTPLLATIVVLVFRTTNRLQANKARLYETFIRLMAGGWDLAKGHLRRSKFTIYKKVQWASALAYQMHLLQRKSFTLETVQQVQDSIFYGEEGSPVGCFLDEIVVDGLLSRSGDAYFFAHLSFQEFLAARSLHHDPTGLPAETALNRYLRGQDWWKEVLFFFVGLSENPRRVASWIRIAKSTSSEQQSSRMAELIRAFEGYHGPFRPN